MKRKPGRPKLALCKFRGSIIAVRLRRRERDAVKAAAARVGMRPSKWMRQVLLTAAGVVE